MSKYPRIEVDFDVLDLDLSNPRIHEKADQMAAMAAVLSVEGEGKKVFALAQNICELGSVDPGDALYAVKGTVADRFVLLDGNRRLTALRLLSQAATINWVELGVPAGIAAQFKKLALGKPDSWPRTVDIVVFPSKAEARPWIRLRHSGENEGAGRSEWNALQIDRFDENGSWRMIKSLWDEALLSYPVEAQLVNGRFEITTLERFVKNRRAQQLFGYAILENAIEWGPTPDHAKRAVASLANDVAVKDISSRSHENDGERDAYLLALFESLQPKPPTVPVPVSAPVASQAPAVMPSPGPTPSLTPGPVETPSSDRTRSHDPAPSPSPAPSPEAGPTKPKPQRPKTKLVQKGEFAWVTDAKSNAVLRELMSLRVADSPYACGLLARTFMELSAQHYLIAAGQAPSNNHDNFTKIGKMMAADKQPNDPLTKSAMITVLSERTEAYAILSQAAHNNMVQWGKDYVQMTWETLSPALQYLWWRTYAMKSATAAAAKAVPPAASESPAGQTPKPAA